MSAIDDNYKELAMAIVRQAAEDYRAALLSDKNTRERIISENERFFKGKWFKILAPNLDGNYLINRLRESANDFRSEADSAFAENRLSIRIHAGYKPDTHAFICPICQGKVYTSYRRLDDIVQVSEEDPDSLSKTGEKWGYRAICASCHTCYNSRREVRMLERPIIKYRKNALKPLKNKKD